MTANPQIDESSAVPKYRQIANLIVRGIEDLSLDVNKRLPSINEISAAYDVSRDTVEKAYQLLKRRGVIVSVRGKGYFATKRPEAAQRKILLLFNKLSEYKKQIYEGFTRTIGKLHEVDLRIYHNEIKLFEEIIVQKAGKYTDYVIIPSFRGQDELQAAEVIRRHIPSEQLFLLNRGMDGVEAGGGSVRQNFEKDIQFALGEADEIGTKYGRLELIFPSNTNYSRAIIWGFQRYCRERELPAEVIYHSLQSRPLQKGTVYIAIVDEDLVTLLKKIRQSGLELGKDIGVIAYNDSPLKEILFEGITVMSTEHRRIGIRAAEMILGNKRMIEECRFRLIRRQSL